MAVRSTWFDRDLPVLEAVVTIFEEEGGQGVVTVRQIAERTGMDPQQVFSALLAMKDVYVGLRQVMAGGDPNPQMVTRVAPLARIATGQWPSPESFADRLVKALETASEEAADGSEKTMLRRAYEALSGMGRDVLVSVVSAAASGALGHH